MKSNALVEVDLGCDLTLIFYSMWWGTASVPYHPFVYGTCTRFGNTETKMLVLAATESRTRMHTLCTNHSSDDRTLVTTSQIDLAS